MNTARMPACECGSVASDFGATAVTCAACGKHCIDVSELTQRTLAKISQTFGVPIEAVVFRCPNSALDKIQQQDLWLKTHYGRDGRSQYQIITDALNDIGDEPPSNSDEIEAVD
jgi:hypothetical protein